MVEPQAANVIFWHYDITNEGTANYPEAGQVENIIFGLYMDSGIGGSALGCDGVYESDDDNAKFDTTTGLNLVYTWTTTVTESGSTIVVIPQATLGTRIWNSRQPNDGIDNDNDGITDERETVDPVCSWRDGMQFLPTQPHITIRRNSARSTGRLPASRSIGGPMVDGR